MGSSLQESCNLTGGYQVFFGIFRLGFQKARLKQLFSFLDYASGVMVALLQIFGFFRGMDYFLVDIASSEQRL